MRKDSSKLFKLIQLQGSVTVLDIQITMSVIKNKIQTATGVLVAHWMSIGNPVCSCLDSNSSLLKTKFGSVVMI